MMSPLREKGVTKQGYLTKAPFHGESNGTPVVVCDHSDPKTSIPCAYIITTKTMAQGVHKLGASWGMTQCRF